MPSYKDAGVDVEAGYESVKLMKEHVKKTYTPGVLSDIGGFGALFQMDLSKYENPVLVSGTDGVGTKLKIAFIMNKSDTVGIDCVAMCVNDVVCSGAEPLFFLDYIAVGKNRPTQIADIVKGVSEGCIQAGCALVGGETAEMPGFYSTEEFDMAGFAVGAVSKGKIIDGTKIKDGDVLIGLPSSGLHSNGFSLVRKVFTPSAEKMNEYLDGLDCSLGEELLKPTKIYVKTALDVINNFNVKGICHVTGGGFFENIPRMGRDGLYWNIKRDTWPILPIFSLLHRLGHVEEMNMYSTFNMGIGMVFCVAAQDAEKIISHLAQNGEPAYIIGNVTEQEVNYAKHEDSSEEVLQKGNVYIH